MELRTWRDILDKRVQEDEAIRLYTATFKMSFSTFKKSGRETSFYIMPSEADDYAPIVDGQPRVLVTYKGDLNSSQFQALNFVCSENGMVTVEGKFKYKQMGETVGEIEASALEF